MQRGFIISGELVPSSLRGHGVFVHGGSPFGSIVSQLLPGVNVDRHTSEVSLHHVFEEQISTVRHSV